MDILNPKALRQKARAALQRGRDPKKVIFSYAAISLAMSLFVTFADLWLEKEISGTGGLGNMGTRAIFATAQQAIPTLLSLAAMCLELGFLNGMLRISRGQYADHTDLKVGFQRFFPLLRMALLQGLIFFALAFFSIQISYVVFLLTPWSDPLMELLYPIVESGTVALDEATLLQATALLGPMFIIFGVVYLLMLVPVLFQLRFANFCLLDDPRAGAMAAMRSSRKLMRRRFLPMLKIELSLWPYHLATAAVSVLVYLDLLLPMLGIPVPMAPETFALVIMIASALAQFAIQMTRRGQTETTYLMAYEQLREKPKDNGVVLGNIFDM